MVICKDAQEKASLRFIEQSVQQRLQCQFRPNRFLYLSRYGTPLAPAPKPRKKSKRKNPVIVDVDKGASIDAESTEGESHSVPDLMRPPPQSPKAPEIKLDSIRPAPAARTSSPKKAPSHRAVATPLPSALEPPAHATGPAKPAFYGSIQAGCPLPPLRTVWPFTHLRPQTPRQDWPCFGAGPL
ncbi:hypothetical protein C1H76_5625 [Elsinoe australis]|uniref:Uncharacterized protein n=1 Tax=Elsinoe australis TaxID=40998 RepID=A0A4U7AVI1_9PEZI|nr:hypothetical protein C1H76_5625 [Elsinoe australis]